MLFRSIKLTDEAGNSSLLTSVVRIHDINTIIPAHFGDSNEQISDRIFNDSFSKKLLSYRDDQITSTLSFGTNEVILDGDFNSITVKICIDDFNAPILLLNNITRSVGITVSPEEFVASCLDVTPVIYRFATEVPTTQVGTYLVGVSAVDVIGNTTTAYAYINIVNDTTPPVIHGVKDKSFLANSTLPNLLEGVYAIDEVSGYTKITYDPSNIKPNIPGVYTVTYYSSDTVGNMTSKTAYVTVLSKPSAKIDVKNILQNPELPNGCEVVSLAIVLKHYGYNINPVELFKKFMPKTSSLNGDPWTTYIGDARDYGFGCLAPCVEKTGNDYLASVNSDKKIYDVSNMPISTYEHYIDSGIPVIMWGLIDMNENKTIAAHFYNREKYTIWYSYSHCLVLIGYTNDKYIFCDPLYGIVEFDKAKVERCFTTNYSKACIMK